MLVVHAGWCPRCEELKASFFDATLAALSRQFVMVNVDADAEPRSQQPPYVPDGDYIPRVMFIDPQAGTVDANLVNDRRTRTRHFYTPADDLVTVMQRALESS
jgi:protein-disulfide reductase (glutathione)